MDMRPRISGASAGNAGAIRPRPDRAAPGPAELADRSFLDDMAGAVLAAGALDAVTPCDLGAAADVGALLHPSPR